MVDTHSKNLNLSSKKPKRARNRLNATERLVLQFLLGRALAGDEYHTYSRDPRLLQETKKSQKQLWCALSSLYKRGLLGCTPGHDVRGCPRLYYLIWFKLREAKELLKAHGHMAALVAVAYGRNKSGSVTTPEIAHVLNISKRTAQRISHTLVQEGAWHRHKNGRKRRYSETKGQLPLEHFSK